MQGQQLAGRYRLGESIGRGGMGRVWRAHDEVLHRTVAVKELTAAQWAAEGDRAVLLARTRAEARAAARINHPAVVTVHDVLEHDDRPWIVMELVEGPSLADAVKEHGRVTPAEAARIGLWTLRALRAAHAAGVLHRDVKPGNVLLARDGQVKLTDFGIAQIEGDTTITRTGEIVGSVDYIAPERVSGAEPGPAADLWALGATLYTAVEGRSPFRRTSPIATMQAVIEDQPEAPEHAGALGPVIGALLHKDPAARPSADTAEAMLAEAAEGRRPSAAQAYVPTQVYAPAPDTTAAPAEPVTGASAPAPAPAPESAVATPASTATATPSTPVQVPASAPGTRRRRWPRVLGALVAALVIGGGGAFGAMYYADHRDSGGAAPTGQEAEGTSAGTGGGDADGGTGAGAQPSAGASPKPGGDPATKNWVRVNPAEGFSLLLPPGWQRVADSSQIDYSPDGGKRFVRIAIDKASDWQNSYQHQLDLERAVDLPDYERLQLRANTFRDRPGSLWEFTWTAGSKDSTSGPRHAIEQTYVAANGTEYAIYLCGPGADWPAAHRQFTQILRGWRPPAP